MGVITNDKMLYQKLFVEYVTKNRKNSNDWYCNRMLIKSTKLKKNKVFHWQEFEYNIGHTFVCEKIAKIIFFSINDVFTNAYIELTSKGK